MGREYEARVPYPERYQMLQRLLAFDAVSAPPQTFAQHPSVRNQHWIRSGSSELPFVVRVFPDDDGFFIEITSLPQDVRRLLEEWLNAFKGAGLELWDCDAEKVIQVEQLYD